MKAEIIDGMLMITPRSNTEEYALDKWFESHSDRCSFIMKPLDIRTDFGYGSYKSAFQRIELWIYKQFPKKAKPQYCNLIDYNTIPKCKTNEKVKTTGVNNVTII